MLVAIPPLIEVPGGVPFDGHEGAVQALGPCWLRRGHGRADGAQGMGGTSLPCPKRDCAGWGLGLGLGARHPVGCSGCCPFR